jgi:hypothetical protein
MLFQKLSVYKPSAAAAISHNPTAAYAVPLTRRKLAPMPSEDEMQREIFARVVETPTAAEHVKNLTPDDVRLLRMFWLEQPACARHARNLLHFAK